MWQNIGWMIGLAWRGCKSVLVLCLITTALAVGVNITQLFIAPKILEKVEQTVPLSELLLTIGVFSLALFLLLALSASGRGRKLSEPDLLYVELLPYVKPAPAIWPLLKTQAGFLPALVYGVSLLLYLIAAIAVTMTAPILDLSDLMTKLSMLPVLVFALIAGQMNYAERWGMQEVERCCRYSYGQLLLARIVCIGAWMFLLNGVLGVVFLTAYEAPLAMLFVWLMPTVIASAAALVPETLFGVRSGLVQMTVFLAAAVLVNQAIPMLLSLGSRMQKVSTVVFSRHWREPCCREL